MCWEGGQEEGCHGIFNTAWLSLAKESNAENLLKQACHTGDMDPMLTLSVISVSMNLIGQWLSSFVFQLDNFTTVIIFHNLQGMETSLSLWDSPGVSLGSRYCFRKHLKHEISNQNQKKKDFKKQVES